MAKTPRPWIVTTHDAIQKLDDNLWTDKARMKDQLSSWSELKGLSRLVPSHGNVVETNAAAALKQAADNA
jgi:hypothetical protein